MADNSETPQPIPQRPVKEREQGDLRNTSYNPGNLPGHVISQTSEGVQKRLSQGAGPLSSFKINTPNSSDNS